MATYAETMRSIAPPATLTIPPSAWATTFVQRPRAAVLIGLRRLSDLDIESARAQAAAKSHRDFRCHGCTGTTDIQQQNDSFNDALMIVAVARASSSPTDVNVPYFEREDDSVRERMTAEGVRFVWDAIERLHLGDSPLAAAATDERLLDLGMALAAPESLAGLPPAQALRLRKLATFMLSELATFPAPES